MILKRQISVLLALFILVINSSASLVLHFCHDEISYVSLVYQENSIIDSTEEDSCCSPQMNQDEQEDKGCCSNQEIKVDKKIDYTIFNTFDFAFQAVFFSETFPVFKKSTEVLRQPVRYDYYCEANAPPFYKLYSQFIFYA